jgi:hypothetical protein
MLIGGGPLGGRIGESLDGGDTWTNLNWPSGTPSWPLILGVAPDDSILVRAADKSGFWIHGGPARPETAAPTCPVDVDLARYLAVAQKISFARWYGCATSAPFGVKVRERVVGSARGLWVDDESPYWWLLRSDVPSYQGAERHDKATEPWTGPPSRVLDATVQRTWAGDLIELRTTDGGRRSYAISGTKWETVSAAP